MSVHYARETTSKSLEYWQGKIPEKYRKGDEPTVAFNVGQLKKMLSDLPDNLPIRSSFSYGATIVVFNVCESYLDPHLAFQDGDYEGEKCCVCGRDFEEEDEAWVLEDGRVICNDCPEQTDHTN